MTRTPAEAVNNFLDPLHHLHLDRGARLGREDRHRRHIPTGRISIADVIRFTITELGVEPLRDDREKILSEAEEAHQIWRTWS